MFQDRWYQSEAAQKLFDRVCAGNDIHPIAAIPTAAGKTVALCRFVDLYLSHFPRKNILVLSHVQEILEQDYDSLRRYFEWDDEADDFMDFTQIGVYSSGLRRKEIKKITVAGIQSIFRKPQNFDHFDIIIIDECHLIGVKEGGMYRDFLDCMTANYVGLTATPFRTGHGYLHKGEGALFTELAYDLTSFENFNRLTDEGYLCRLFSKKTSLKLSVDGVRMVAGDYSQRGLSKNIDRDNITKAAVLETIHFGKNYKRWLFFAIDIHHAERIVHFLKEQDISAIAIHSKMEGSRGEILQEAKSGKYRAIVNVDVLTTGYNDPQIDLIALLRPTASPIFHVQAPGRGLRPVYEDGYDLNTIEGRLDAQKNGPKPHCLVLDFAGNCSRLGPINDVFVKEKTGSGGGGGPMVKDCPECNEQNHLSAKKCCACEYEFPIREKLMETADAEADVVRESEKKPAAKLFGPQWHDVTSINYSVQYTMNGQPPFFVATYLCENKRFVEKVFLDGKGYARFKAKYWVALHWDDANGPKPESVEELRAVAHKLKLPCELLVDERKKPIHVEERRFW